MPVWNGSTTGLTQAQAQAAAAAAITAADLPNTSEVASICQQAINFSSTNNVIPSWNDVQALTATQNKTGLQRTSLQFVGAGTNASICTDFPGIGYGVWRVMITCSVLASTVQLRGSGGANVMAYPYTLAVGSSLTLSSDYDFLWRTPLSEGLNIDKTTGATLTVEVWFDYLYS